MRAYCALACCTHGGRTATARSKVVHCVMYYLSQFAGAVLLADSAYPAGDWCIPPINLAHNQQQRNFNVAHKCTRRIVECTIGLLKMRWRILLNGLRVRSMTFAVRAIKACCVLHNICLQYDPLSVGICRCAPCAHELLQNDDLNGMLNDPDFGEHDEDNVNVDDGLGAAGGNFGRRNQLIALFPDALPI